jgi:hypothetical protein
MKIEKVKEKEYRVFIESDTDQVLFDWYQEFPMLTITQQRNTLGLTKDKDVRTHS